MLTSAEHVVKERKFHTSRSVCLSDTTLIWCLVWDTREIVLCSILGACPSWPGITQHKTRCLNYQCCRIGCGSRWDGNGTVEPFGCQPLQPPWHHPSPLASSDVHLLAPSPDPLPKASASAQPCAPSHPAVVDSRLPSGHRGAHGGLPSACPAVSTGKGRWVEVQWGLASVPALQGCVHGALVSDAQELLGSFPSICRRFPGQVAVTSCQVCAHALKELLDADLGKVSGMLRTRLVEQLTLDVDVVGPIPALQEGSLGETGPEGSDQESQCSHQQHKAPAQSLQGRGDPNPSQAEHAPSTSHQPAGAPWAANEPGSTLSCLSFYCVYIANAGQGDPTVNISASSLKFCSMHPCRQHLPTSHCVWHQQAVTLNNTKPNPAPSPQSFL